MFLGEVVGTALLILIGDGVVAGVLLDKSKAQNSGWVVITWAWAMGVFVGVLGSLAVSEGVAHLNPAVTVGLASIGLFEWSDVPTAIGGQFLGAVHRRDPRLARLPRALGRDRGPGSEARGLLAPDRRSATQSANVFTEVIGTFVVGVRGARDRRSHARRRTADRAPATGALPVALLVLAIGMALGGPTGYAINPARDLGPRIIHAILPIPGKGGSDWSYSWIPVVGPIVGGVIGAVAAKAIFDL